MMSNIYSALVDTSRVEKVLQNKFFFSRWSCHLITLVNICGSQTTFILCFSCRNIRPWAGLKGVVWGRKVKVSLTLLRYVSLVRFFIASRLTSSLEKLQERTQTEALRGEWRKRELAAARASEHSLFSRLSTLALLAVLLCLFVSSGERETARS